MYEVDNTIRCIGYFVGEFKNTLYPVMAREARVSTPVYTEKGGNYYDYTVAGYRGPEKSECQLRRFTRRHRHFRFRLIARKREIKGGEIQKMNTSIIEKFCTTHKNFTDSSFFVIPASEITSLKVFVLKELVFSSPFERNEDGLRPQQQ